MELFLKILFLVLAYLLGSIPFGYVLGKLKGVDTGRVYKPGHKVLLTIKDATYVDKSIYYNLIDNLTLTESDSNKLTRKL